MTSAPIVRIPLDELEWPAATPIDAARVLGGAPETSTVVVESGDKYSLGLWKVSPGEFSTDHTGYVEYINVLSGSGQLVDDEGTVTELSPGVTVLMRSGWKGRWVVRETLTKIYTIIRD